VETREQLAHAARGGAEALTVLEVHQFAPIEVGVLEDGGFLTPFRMIGPEFLADVGQFEPGVYQDALAMSGFDELLEVGVLLRAGFEKMPGGNVQRSDARLAPASGEVI